MNRHKRELPEVIFLDHDGTLVDSETVHFDVWKQVLNDYGVVLSKVIYGAEFVGLSELDTAAVLRRRYGLAITSEALVVKKRAVASRYQEKKAFPVLPTVNECLRLWSEMGVRMAVVSGSNQVAVRRSVAACGWESMLEAVFTGDQVARNKPAPDVYQLALRRMGVSPSKAIAIEDSCTGLSSATAAGIPCYVVSSAWSSGQDFSAALEVVGSMRAVQASLLGSMGAMAG